MRSIVLAGFLLLPLLCSAQIAEGESPYLQPVHEAKDVLTVPELKQPVRDRFDFGLDMGTAFTTFGRHGSLFTNYLAPEIRYQAAPRLHFSTGIVLSTGFMPGSGLEGSGNRFNRVLVYAEGAYRLNPRLTIGGMVVKELDNDFQRQMHAFQKNSGFQSVGMSVDYKITDNMRIGARFNITEGRPYYYTDPANPFIRRSPFSPGW
jgi:hypothetical protein